MSGIENAVLSFNIVFPMFIMLALGYFMRVRGMWDDPYLTKLNGIVFKTFFPMYIFMSIYQTDLSSAINPSMLSFMLVYLFTVIVGSWILIPHLEPDRKKQGVMIQGLFRGNILLFGIPITESLYGGDYVGLAAVIVGCIVPVYNVVAVIVLEGFRGGKPNVKKMVKGVLTNPLILGAAAAVVCLLFHITLPSAVEKGISDMAKITTPLSMVILGGSFYFSQVRHNLRPLLIILIGKLIVLPALGLGAAILLGFRGPELGILVVMLTVPVAVSSFTMAQQMDGDAELAGQVVVFSAVCSIVTIFLWIFAFKQLALI